MLDDETLREVGRFAIEFSTLNDVITSVAGASLECAEWEIAQYLTDHLTIGRKLERIATVCATLAKAHELVDTDLYKALVERIGFAKRIIDERNAVIHGELTVKRGERPSFRSNKLTLDLSSNDLAALVQKIDCASLGLITAHTDFMDAVYKARAAGRNSPT